MTAADSKTLEFEKVESVAAGGCGGVDGDMSCFGGWESRVGGAVGEGKQHGRGTGEIWTGEGEVGEEEAVVGGEGGG